MFGNNKFLQLYCTHKTDLLWKILVWSLSDIRCDSRFKIRFKKYFMTNLMFYVMSDIMTLLLYMGWQICIFSQLICMKSGDIAQKWKLIGILVQEKCMRWPLAMQTEWSVQYKLQFFLLSFFFCLGYFSPGMGCPRVLFNK